MKTSPNGVQLPWRVHCGLHVRLVWWLHVVSLEPSRWLDVEMSWMFRTADRSLFGGSLLDLDFSLGKHFFKSTSPLLEVVLQSKNMELLRLVVKNIRLDALLSERHLRAPLTR